MDNKVINEMGNGDRIEGFFMIRSSAAKTSNANKKYIDFNLGDRTGEINAKLWDSTEEDEKDFMDSKVIKIRGVVNLYQNVLQLKIEKIRLTVEDDEVDAAELVPVAPYKPEDMYQMILDYVNKIKNTDMKNIINAMLEENNEKLMYYPAAQKNHHSIRSGLLYHITTMLRAGEKLSEVYTFLNMDLLYSGIILHDMAKIDEMDSSDLGIVSQYTVEGQLIGHIIQGIKKVEVVSEKVKADKEITILLEHMILSHHYEAEYGSPKKPMIPEAEILHYLDKMDATMFDMQKALTGTNPGSFSDSIWSLDKRKIYKISKEF